MEIHEVPDDIFLATILFPKFNIFHDTHVEENRFLAHNPNIVSHPSDVQVFYIGAIQLDRTSVWVVKPIKKIL